MEAPVELKALTGDGKSQRVVGAGGAVPCETRLVFATERAGQRELTLRLAEGEGEPFAELRFELPAGLPANCWLPVFLSVDAGLRVRGEARENLRRVRVSGVAAALGAPPQHYSA